jgi:hypothetical protein
LTRRLHRTFTVNRKKKMERISSLKLMRPWTALSRRVLSVSDPVTRFRSQIARDVNGYPLGICESKVPSLFTRLSKNETVRSLSLFLLFL